MRGGTGVLTSEDTSPVHPVSGPGAACSHPSVAASHGWSGPAQRITLGLSQMSGPHPLSGMAAYPCAGVCGARVAAHYRLHSRAHSSPTMRASHAVMEARPMIHGGTRASCRCLEKNPPAGPGTGGGPLVAGTPECHSRHGGRLRSPCQGTGEEGGGRRSEPSVHLGCRA